MEWYDLVGKTIVGVESIGENHGDWDTGASDEVRLTFQDGTRAIICAVHQGEPIWILDRDIE